MVMGQGNVMQQPGYATGTPGVFYMYSITRTLKLRQPTANPSHARGPLVMAPPSIHQQPMQHFDMGSGYGPQHAFFAGHQERTQHEAYMSRPMSSPAQMIPPQAGYWRAPATESFIECRVDLMKKSVPSKAAKTPLVPSSVNVRTPHIFTRTSRF